MGNDQKNRHNIDAQAKAAAARLLEGLPDHSIGSILSDFTKPNARYENGLSPAEEKLLEACIRGELCVIGNGKRPNAQTPENEIRASFLRYLMLDACEKVELHQSGLKLKGAYIHCTNGNLDLHAVNIQQDAGIVNCKIDGDIILVNARCKKLILSGSSVKTIEAYELQSDGDLFLRDQFYASGTVRLLNAKISGDLDCSNGKFDGAEDALLCDGMETKGGVYFSDHFHASGNVRLPSAKIDGDLACRDGIFRSDIIAQNTQIGGNVWLDEGFQLSGSLSLANAHVGGNVQCASGIFHSKDSAIHGNKAVIEGNVILGNCNAAGTFAFQSARIGGDFSAQGATLSAKSCIQLRNTQVVGTFHWRSVKHAPGMLDLGGASVKTLNMDEISWQKPAAIKLNNFIYQGFQDLEEGASSNYWIRFLEKQPDVDLTSKFRPKPFEQLAGNLQAIGFEAEAIAIRVERQRRQTAFLANYDPERFTKDGIGKKHINWMHKLNVFWRKYISGVLVDYGYRPGKAAIYLFSLILIGMVIYWHAANKGIMTPTHPLIFKEATNGGFIPERCADNWVYFPNDIADKCADSVPSEYSEFQSLIYAADVALPIVNLRMEADWAPRVVDIKGNRDWHGYLVRLFEWFLITAGWVLSLLFASAVGGIIRR